MPIAVSNRKRVVAWATAALVMCALLAPPATAKPTPAPPAPKGQAAAAAPVQDFSSRLPRTTRDEITGDFLGLGYEQHMRAEGSALNIYDPPALGGEVRKSTPLDLGPPPNTVGYWYGDSNNVTPLTPWAQYILGTDCNGCFQGVDDIYHIRSVYLAYVDGWVYISGTKGDAIDGGDNDPGTFPPAGHTEYQNLLYKVPANATCAVESCAEAEGAVTELPDQYVVDGNIPDYNRPVGVTALAAGTSGGNSFVAVGLTDFGTLIFDGDLTNYHEYAGEPTGGQTPVISLAFDPYGSGMLAVGLLSPGAHSLTTQVNPDGTVTGTRGSLALGGGATLNPFPLSVTFGRGSDKGLVVAWGYNDGTVRIGDPQALNSQELAGGTSPAGISVLDAVPRPDGSGADDYAVAMQETADITGPLIGGMWRWKDGVEVLEPQKVTVDGSGNASTVLPTRDAYRRWFPGFKQGRFKVQNTSGEAVTVKLKARANPGYGCWWAGTWIGAGPLPDDGITVPAGQTSPLYVMGAYTGGDEGGCGATDVSGDWRGYLVVTPVARPADTRLVNLQISRGWALDVSSDQNGGSTTVTAQKTGQLSALGEWQLTVDTPDAPTAATAPQVNGTVLTTSLKTRASVYRFDVGALKWTVPTTANPAVQVVIPPLQVEGLAPGTTTWPTTGCTAGSTCATIGYLMPITRLVAGTNAVSGVTTSVTVGQGTFYWENTTAATYSQIRVRAGSGASDPVSAPIVLSSLSGPSPNTAISSVTATPTSANVTTAGVATPAANGVDQSAVTVQLNTGGGTLPPTDPAYQYVYYRTNGNLITNLYGTATTKPKGDFSAFVGVQPQPGAVIPQSRNNSTAFNDYVSSTSTNIQTITPSISLGVTKTDANGFQIQAGTFAPAGPGTGTDASAGFSLEGCSVDFSASHTCRIANATGSAPALYQAGLTPSGDELTGLPLIGANVGYQAFDSMGALPMEWQPAQGAQNLSAAAVTLRNTQSQAIFSADEFLPTDVVDISLVTHAQSVSVTVTVGAG